jgi:putative PIN family toxin of toxin-antitoxin system
VISATLDTNVIVSGILFQGPPRRCLEAAIAGRYRPAASHPILTETESVLQRRKFGLTDAFVAITMRELESLCDLHFPKVLHNVVIRDPKDNMIVDCAVEATANYIVSGDKDLLSLGTAVGIPIVSPAVFIDALADA